MKTNKLNLLTHNTHRLEMGKARGRQTAWTFIYIFVLTAYTTVVSLVSTGKQRRSKSERTVYNGWFWDTIIPFFQVYLIVNDPTFHEVAYGLMVVSISYLGFRNLGRV